MNQKPKIINIVTSDQMKSDSIFNASRDGIIIDVSLSKDKMPVVISAKNDKNTIRNKNMLELDNALTLTETIELIKQNENLYLIINILDNDKALSKKSAELIAGIVHDLKPENSVISSSSIKQLKFINSIFPTLQTMLKINNHFPFFHFLLSIKSFSTWGVMMSLNFSSSLVCDLKKNRKVFLKIDSEKQIDDIISLEPDFIITNQPTEIHELLNEKWRVYAGR